MKIAFLNIYNGNVERGAEIFVRELAGRLNINHDVCVYQTSEGRGEKYDVRKVWGIPFSPHQKSAGFSLYHFWVFIFTLKCLPDLWKRKYDWIIPINGRWQVLICRVFRFLRGGKILISGQAGVGFDDRWNMMVGNPDAFVALSPKAFSWAKSIYPVHKVIYIPNGVDTDKFKPVKSSLRLPVKEPVIICVSALLPYKRIELLVEAVSRIKTAGLIVIGDGPEKYKLEKSGKSLLGTRFILIPHISHEKIVKYYNCARVFSLPSRESEAFGLVYLEAMACNLPVVAPDDENRHEIIKDAGFLGNVEDVGSYAKLLDKALKTDFGIKPRKQAEKFSWGKIAEKYEEILGKA